MATPISLPLHKNSNQHERWGTQSLPLVFFVAFAGVALGHLTLLHLPYFWDEGGYYVPAALDFYHTGTLIPVFTNAHPPLPSIVLGSLWHVFGFHIIVTRLTACAFAALALTAVFFLANRLLGAVPALVLTLLTAIYPIWYAQSSLAHADIFAAAFSLAALAVYLTSPEHIGRDSENLSSRRRLACTAALFSLSALAKETAIVQPAALLAYESVLAIRARRAGTDPEAHWRWVGAMAVPIPLLACWFGYHFLKTGHIFGNPAFLHYNATDNLHLGHILYALRIRFVHLFWQRNIWLPLTLAAACLLLPRLPKQEQASRLLGLPRRITLCIAVLVVANLVAFSFLGGALLTRYLLPIYPLLLLVCVAVWRERVEQWPWLALLSGVAFFSAIWLNPSTFFAPEDNLTYRNMIEVQQGAIAFLNSHYPDATVLTAWPVSADLFRPELGYTERKFRVFEIDNFSAEQLAKAAQQPGRFDTAILFTTHYIAPGFRRYLLANPTSWRGRRYHDQLDKSPQEIARMLGGQVVWLDDRYGEWAAVVRFPRSYDARLATPTQPSSR